MLLQRIDLSLCIFFVQILTDMTQIHRDDEAGLLPCQSMRSLLLLTRSGHGTRT